MRIVFDAFPTLTLEGRRACGLIASGLVDMAEQDELGFRGPETLESIWAKNPGMQDEPPSIEKLTVDHGPELELVYFGLGRQIDKTTKETGLASEVHSWHAALVSGKIVRQTHLFRSPSPYQGEVNMVVMTPK